MGKRRLEKALANHKSNIDAEIKWRPFQLDASLPRGTGYNKMEMYQQKFGADRIRSMIPYMRKVGKEVGIDFSYGGSIGNTFDSHRFIWQAREVGGSDLQDKMVDALFEAYFENEQSLGDPKVLEESANTAGMPADITTKLLQDDTLGAAAVEQERTAFRSKWNCTGVPLFIVDGKYPLSGAQPAEAFDEIFDEILES